MTRSATETQCRLGVLPNGTRILSGDLLRDPRDEWRFYHQDLCTLIGNGGQFGWSSAKTDFVQGVRSLSRRAHISTRQRLFDVYIVF